MVITFLREIYCSPSTLIFKEIGKNSNDILLKITLEICDFGPSDKNHFKNNLRTINELH